MTTRITLILAAGLVLIALAYFLTPSPPPPPAAPPTTAPPTASVQQPVSPAPSAEAPSPAEPEEPPLPVTVKQVKCTKIVEPYVIRTDTGEEIRLLGLRLPEHANTKEAIKRIVEEQTASMLSRELILEIINEVDLNGRPLAFAYYPNRMMANRQLIARGYASVDPQFLPKKILEPFMALERSAAEGRSGIWQRD
jgi:endonuclease YncB( thermonuclease family)